MKLFGIVIGFASANPLLNYVQTRIITLEKNYEKKTSKRKIEIKRKSSRENQRENFCCLDFGAIFAMRIILDSVNEILIFLFENKMLLKLVL